MTDMHGSSTPQVFLDSFDNDSADSIAVTLCMIWDFEGNKARLLNTDFVVSDSTGNVIQCSAKATIAFNFHQLGKGVQFSIEDFVVQSNNEEYHARENNTFKLDFDGATTLRKSPVLCDQYVRYPLQKIHMDNMKPTRNKSLIDVVGYVTNIAKMNHTKTGSKNLHFYLSNHRGQAVHVTFWGGFGDLRIDSKMKHAMICPIVINSTSARRYSNILSPSKTSSAMGIDEPNIPTSKQFKSTSGYDGQIKSGICFKNCVPRCGTMKALLMWSRNQTNDFATFHLKATIGNIRTEKGWRFPSCGGKQCQKGTIRMGGGFWCNGCEKEFAYPEMRYRLALDVYDNTDKSVFVLFDEPAIQLVKCPASSLMLMEHNPSDECTSLPPPLANLIGTTHVFEIKTHTFYDHGISESFICCAIDPLEFPAPTIATPSKSTEVKKNKRYGISDSDLKRKKTHQNQNL